MIVGLISRLKVGPKFNSGESCPRYKANAKCEKVKW